LTVSAQPEAQRGVSLNRFQGSKARFQPIFIDALFEDYARSARAYSVDALRAI